MVEAALCASFGEDRYLGSLELGGGALKNMGCYPIMIADYLFPNGPPETISAVGNVKEGGEFILKIFLTFGRTTSINSQNNVSRLMRG